MPCGITPITTDTLPLPVSNRVAVPFIYCRLRLGGYRKASQKAPEGVPDAPTRPEGHPQERQPAVQDGRATPSRHGRRAGVHAARVQHDIGAESRHVDTRRHYYEGEQRTLVACDGICTRVITNRKSTKGLNRWAGVFALLGTYSSIP